MKKIWTIALMVALTACVSQVPTTVGLSVMDELTEVCRLHQGEIVMKRKDGKNHPYCKISGQTINTTDYKLIDALVLKEQVAKIMIQGDTLSKDPALAPVGLANPASEFCVKQGGKLEPKKDAQNSSDAMCHLPDGQVVEEWEYFRKHKHN